MRYVWVNELPSQPEGKGLMTGPLEENQPTQTTATDTLQRTGPTELKSNRLFRCCRWGEAGERGGEGGRFV